ncbi:hypothetical protein KEM48_011291 [Puccinia striiformis f. sp. tritici PST-130]|nr:hypothetical protein KEM48_011291 [Puccinia striiformis f. sp. tritici PST-130]
MQSDDVVWGIINHQFCSYKIKAAPGGGHSHNKAVGQNFCKNEYNATGLCNKASCPLANSRYATVREIGGIVYLFQKTVERAHSPANLWEKTRLSTNYAKALEQLSDILAWFHDSPMPQLVAIKSKTERREKAREAKALSAARLTKTLEKELIGRLKSKTYGDAPLNVNEDVWRSVLEGEKRKELEQENELELEDEETDEDSDDDGDEEEEREFVSDLEESDLEDMEDWDDGLGTDDDDEAEVGSDASSQDGDAEGIDLNIDKGSSSKRKASQASSAPAQKKIKPTNAQDPKSKKKRKPRMEIEYEEEQEWLGTQV